MAGARPDEVLVKDLMVANVHVVEIKSTVKDAAAVMVRERHGCVIVVNGPFAAGIVTERDIVNKVTSEGIGPSKVRAEDIMSSPLITISPEATIREAAEKMSTFEIKKSVV